MQKLKQQLSNIKPDDLMFGLIVLTFLLLPTGTAPPLISLGLAALVWIISGKIRCIPSIVRQSWFYPVIPFLVLPWAGLLYSENFDLGMDYALKTKYWVAVFLTAGIAFDEKRLTFLLKWFWAGLLMGAFLALIQFVGIMPPIKEGFLGFGVVHTLICMYLIIGIMMASFYFKKAESWQSKLVLFFLILAFVFHLAVLKGRAGYLIFAILSPLVANNLMNKFSVKLKILMSILLVGLLLLSPVVRAVIKDTVTTLNEQKEKILKGENVDKAPRFFMVHETVEIILAHPFIGVGTGGLAEITKAKGHMVEHPHNNFLYMGASYGIFGIAACFWLFWSMVKISWKSRKTALGYFAFSTCIVLFLGGMFDTQILNTGTLLFLSLTYGLLNHLGNPVD